jgi:hypothetical protein
MNGVRNLGFSGSRDGLLPRQEAWLVAFLVKNKESVKRVYHGDCVGSDAEFHDLVREIIPEAEIIIHPPTNPRFRAFKKGDETMKPDEYLRRNRRIVAACDYLVAFPREEENNDKCVKWHSVVPVKWISKKRPAGGTWHTISIARLMGKPRTIVGPREPRVRRITV